MLYEKLSKAQAEVESEKEQWKDFETTLQTLQNSIEDHSEIDSLLGEDLKAYMAENFVVKYSNLELARAEQVKREGKSHIAF